MGSSACIFTINYSVNETFYKSLIDVTVIAAKYLICVDSSL